MMQANGFAVVATPIIGDRRIDMNTVYSTRRGAIVNWLIKSRGIPIHVGMADVTIEQLWQQYSDGAEVVPVTVTVS